MVICIICDFFHDMNCSDRLSFSYLVCSYYPQSSGSPLVLLCATRRALGQPGNRDTDTMPCQYSVNVKEWSKPYKQRAGAQGARGKQNENNAFIQRAFRQKAQVKLIVLIMLPVGLLPARSLPVGLLPAHSLPVGLLPAHSLPVGLLPAQSLPVEAVSL